MVKGVTEENKRRKEVVGSVGTRIVRKGISACTA